MAEILKGQKMSYYILCFLSVCYKDVAYVEWCGHEDRWEEILAVAQIFS